jgi:hypothetical protein
MFGGTGCVCLQGNNNQSLEEAMDTGGAGTLSEPVAIV